MAIITHHQVTCPYCGLKQLKQMANENLEHTRMVTCDFEEGGCERIFAVQVVLLPRVQVYELTPAGSSAPIEDYDRRRDIEAPAVQ